MHKESEQKKHSLSSDLKPFFIKTPEELKKVSEFASTVCMKFKNEKASKFFKSSVLNSFISRPDSLAIAIKSSGDKIEGFLFAHLIKGPVRNFVNCYVGTNSGVTDGSVGKMLNKIVTKFKEYGHQTIFRIEGLTEEDVRNASKFFKGFQGKGISFNAVSIAQPSGI